MPYPGKLIQIFVRNLNFPYGDSDWKTNPAWIVAWMSITEIGLCHARKFGNRRLDEFSRNLPWSNFGDDIDLKLQIENFEFFDTKKLSRTL